MTAARPDALAPRDAAGPETVESGPADAVLTRRLLLARRAMVAGLAGLAAGLVWLVLDAGTGPVEMASLAVFALVCAAMAVMVVTEQALARRRREREAGLMRFATRLSRSASPEEVVETIIADLSAATDADHVIVARVRQADQSVEVTLVAAHSGAVPSRTSLRAEVPERPRWRAIPVGDVGATAAADGAHDREERAQAAADEIARRVRSTYALAHTLAEPLVSGRRFLGALILSRRSRAAWSEADQRLLSWAAAEVSPAFARAYALEAAEQGARTDALTGLPNRRSFEEALASARPRRRSTDSVGILMIDIDHFKRLNDRHGHATGDKVLRAVATAIAAQVRTEDTPARYGGEEFAVLVRRTSGGQAAEVGERIRLAVGRLAPATYGVDEPVSVSVGMAVAEPGETDLAGLVERADQALYRAKRLGRDRVEVA